MAALTVDIVYGARLCQAKYLGALADRLFRDECARLGLDANEAINSPLASIINRRGQLAFTPEAEQH